MRPTSRLALRTTGLVAMLLISGVPFLAQATPKAKPAAKPAAKAVAAAPLPAPEKVTSVEGITEYRLGNGLRVLLFPDPSKPTITVNITYLVGSRHENYGETGMAHLLEHLVFKPSKKFSGKDGAKTPVEVLNSVGARFNGTTWYDRTNYFVSFPASDANFDTILDLEADRMVNANIAKKDLWDEETKKGEMTVVRNEFEIGENDPMGVTLERTISTAFDWHNYGKSTIGARADIENVNIERLQAFYRAYYQPDNAVLLVAGKFDEAQALAKINERFGRIPRPTRALQQTYTLDPIQDGERTITVRRVGDVQAVMSLYKTPAGSDPEAPAMQVLAYVMGDTPSGRLYKALVETKKASAVFPFAASTKEPGFILFGAQVPKDGNLEDARETLLKALEASKDQPITQEEVDRAKQAILKQVDLTLNASDRLGVGMSEYIALGDWRLFFLNRDRIKKVTPIAVRAAAEKYFKQSNRTVGQFIPTAAPDRAEIPAPKDVAAMVKDYKGQAVVAQGEAFDATPANIDSRTVTFATAAGLKVSLLAKKTRGETVSATFNLRLGTEQTLMNKGAAGPLTGSMLLRGTSKHTRQQIKDEFDRLKAQVSVNGSNELARVSITTIKPNLPAVLELVTEVLREPSFPASELETLVKERVTQIEEQKNEPTSIAITAISRHMNAHYPKGHPRYVDSLEESVQDLKAAKVEDLKAFHQTFYGASAGELAVVGDFDPATLRKQVEGAFGTWKAATSFTRIPSKYMPTAAVNKSFEAPDKANAFFVAAFTMPLKESDPDYPAMMLGDYMLGGGALKSRLADRIRQKEGLSYGVGSQFNASPFDPAASWNAYAMYNPSNTAKLETAFNEELAKVLKDGFTAEEIKDAKTAWLQAQASARAQDRELAGRLAGNLFQGRTMAWNAGLEAKVQALTGEQILAAMKKHFDPAKLSIVKAGDFAKAAKDAEKK